ncbi:bleomycin resistance protein [Agreia pratensis]|uniref:Bleomycin resistance protein n=1 Tax=Agreia pratensis TaxID=150121 RepID=A0A1X7J990_9MICO|nr:VOC family protein [Agreia pratensis]SMG24182.1 Catechol 2,3-dioxygenase [Agreia pratensis]
MARSPANGALAAVPPALAWHNGSMPDSADSALEPALVPEFLVTNLDASLAFWRDLCGFTVLYDRPEERFAYLTLGSAHLMLEEIGDGRHWITAPLELPFGRGINFQISVPDAEGLAASMSAADIPFFLPLETTWYRVGDEETGVTQFIVTDPDGYLVRFQSSLGRRPLRVSAA